MASMRSAYVIVIATGCAAAPAKSPWPSEPQGPSITPAAAGTKTNSVSSGGPRSESGSLNPTPPVKIQYGPLRGSVRQPTAPTTLLLTWPLPTTGITSLYGRRPDPMDGEVRFHRGLDMEAEYGDTVKASADGQVVAAGWNGGYGRQIVVEHAGGYQTVYAHLSQILVPLRARVEAGQPIALVGNSGRSTGAHLHFEVLEWGQHVDPLEVLGVELPLE